MTTTESAEEYTLRRRLMQLENPFYVSYLVVDLKRFATEAPQRFAEWRITRGILRAAGVRP